MRPAEVGEASSLCGIPLRIGVINKLDWLDNPFAVLSVRGFDTTIRMWQPLFLCRAGKRVCLRRASETWPGPDSVSRVASSRGWAPRCRTSGRFRSSFQEPSWRLPNYGQGFDHSSVRPDRHGTFSSAQGPVRRREYSCYGTSTPGSKRKSIRRLGHSPRDPATGCQRQYANRSPDSGGGAFRILMMCLRRARAGAASGRLSMSLCVMRDTENYCFFL